MLTHRAGGKATGLPGAWVVAALGLALLAPAPGAAVVVRHDRDPARTAELGAEHPYVGSAGSATGTLIRPRWVLTAAHVVEEFSPFDFRAQFDGTEYPVRRACVHPGDIEMPWDRRVHDIALLRLAEPVSEIQPVGIYRGGDELGRQVVIGGVGYFGTQETGPVRRDGVRRAVTNRVLDLEESWLKVVFSRPPGGTDLEGVGAPGDSGGPLLIETDGVTRVAGVSAYVEFIDAEGDEGSYGSLEFYARVASYADWIDSVIRAVESGDLEGCEGPEPPERIESARDGLPDTPAGRAAEAYFEAFNSGDPDAYRRFTLEHRTPEAVEAMSMEERLEGYRSTWQEWGRLELEEHVAADGVLYVRATSRAGRLVFGFTAEPEPPHRLLAISVAN